MTVQMRTSIVSLHPAEQRPLNSALELDLDFERTIKPPPPPTEEGTASLEVLIRCALLYCNRLPFGASLGASTAAVGAVTADLATHALVTEQSSFWQTCCETQLPCLMMSRLKAHMLPSVLAQLAKRLRRALTTTHARSCDCWSTFEQCHDGRAGRGSRSASGMTWRGSRRRRPTSAAPPWSWMTRRAAR